MQLRSHERKGKKNEGLKSWNGSIYEHFGVRRKPKRLQLNSSALRGLSGADI